mmetsp:Transcript_30358/g.46460  ORF Transcript_30358/g.46460 Transcript_30358/m.46460 type:complete len:224 (-) Transcript_30358:1361-2032(-)
MHAHDYIWRSQASLLAKISVSLFNRLIGSLKPTPTKSHYRLNVRHIAEVIQGLLRLPPPVSAKTPDKKALMYKLWIHECRRGFSDRLICEEDEEVFERAMFDQLEAVQGIDYDKEDYDLSNSQLLFSNFTDPVISLDYNIITDRDKFVKILEEEMEKYNALFPRAKFVGIQMFEYMIEHLCRFTRILSQKKGHGLLVSLGGNGRQVLIKLASFLTECSPHIIS